MFGHRLINSADIREAYFKGCHAHGEIYLSANCRPLSSQVKVQQTGKDSVDIFFFPDSETFALLKHGKHGRGESTDSTDTEEVKPEASERDMADIRIIKYR